MIQPGFKRFYDTTFALSNVTEQMMKSILLHFSKPLDRIDHSILCKKPQMQYTHYLHETFLAFLYLAVFRTRRDYPTMGVISLPYIFLNLEIAANSI